MASVQREGSDANILVNTAAAMGDLLSYTLTRMWAALFFSTAQGTDLDRLALDRYNLIRKPAASALTSVQLTAPTPVLAPFTIPVGTIFSSPAGLNFQSTIPVTWNVNQASSPLIPVASVLAGANQQVAVNSLTNPPSIQGLPTGTTCTNPVASAGAADSETDDDFRSRCIAFPSSLLQGTLAAITQAALAVPGVMSAQAIELLNSSGQQNGIVQLVITDGFTDLLANLNQNPPTYQTQSQQLANQVQTQLLNARAGGVFVQPIVAQVELVQVLLSLSFQAGIDVDQAALSARIAVTNYTNTLPPGVPWSPADARANALTVPGVIAAAVASPAGPVIPTVLQVIRTSLGLVVAAQSAGSIISQGGNALPLVA